MNFDHFKTYGDSPQNAFETLCTQLFERYLRRTYTSRIVKFRVVNGKGGDGGIEAYGELDNGDLIALQVKWFRNTIDTGQIGQIQKSVDTALTLRKNIKEYITCIPRSHNSLKFGRGTKGKGKKPITKTEEGLIDTFTAGLTKTYPATTFTWWYEQQLQFEVYEPGNEGVHKFWFEHDVISQNHLVQQFNLEKSAWIEKRYIPELHGQGAIQNEIQRLLYNSEFRKLLLKQFSTEMQTLQTTSGLISSFNQTLPPKSLLEAKLNKIQGSIDTNLSQCKLVSQAIIDGLNDIPSITLQPISITGDLLGDIQNISPSDIQIGIKIRLLNSFNQLRNVDLKKVLSETSENANQLGRLFIGNAGTGKTHALTNTVDNQLNKKISPAIIIRAKGTPCSDWTSILKKALDLVDWDRNEILLGLESLAIRADQFAASKLSVGEELKMEPTKVVICIDGLEEDTAHWSEWYERMRQSLDLMKLYPRVRFIYTARTYFLDNSEIPVDLGFKVFEIPSEGDVPVSSLIEDYFSPEHYDIEVNPKSLIRGIDSLYALRLFCELYKGKKLTSSSDVITAERDLLNKKVEIIESDFKKIKNAGKERKPIQDTLGVLSEVFYKNVEIEHEELAETLHSGTLKYLDKGDIETLIEYMVNNGFLIKSKLPVTTGILPKIKIIYNLTYQSIMELIMSEKYADAISSGELNALPSHLLELSKSDKSAEVHQINERIVQQVVDKVLNDTGQLIGHQNFLTEGVDGRVISELQIKALIKAPPEIAKTFRPKIDELFFKDYKSRFQVFENLIYPSSISVKNYFGAEYLHELLMTRDTPFDREIFWLGWDRWDIHELGETEKNNFYQYNLQNIIDPYGEELHLPEFSLHNEYPLIFGWALATLDQSFRERLRVALTEWALKDPQEYLLLLDKLFTCNDPQIHEDLGAITLGVASKLKDTESLALLAHWSLDNIFDSLSAHRNVIIRTGFRAIVEKAFSLGAITDVEVQKARPHPLQDFKIIPTDSKALSETSEEIYPIVHDLAWYVIKRAFDDFLEYASVDADVEYGEPSEIFLKKYLDELGLKHLNAYSWSISAAIAYMKFLGFSRHQGNSWTEASHGSKSKNFTLEEKYTWLAVHYLQGYLADHVPLSETKNSIDDYMKIVSISNPAEALKILVHPNSPDIPDNWLIREPLAPEMDGIASIDDQIKNAVENDPIITFEKWLEFKEHDFRVEGNDDEWLAIFNYTTVHDSKDYIYSSIDARGVIIEKGEVPALLNLIKHHPKNSYFVEHIDLMVASPDTDTYSNPADIVWMQWIQELNSNQKYYIVPQGIEKEFRYTLTSVTRNTVEGENEIYIPSKIVRKLMEITSLDEELFLDNNDKLKGFNHIVTLPNYDRQEMTLVSKVEFLDKLKDDNLEIVWFVDLYRSKNPLNKSSESNEHPMKTRKYLVWYSKGKIVSEKIWDERFSNQRDTEE